MKRYEGHVADVRDAYEGDVLAQAATHTDTELVLEDASVFEEDGGRLQIDDDLVVDYTTVDYDANRVFLTDPLGQSFEDGVSVVLYPYVIERRASVYLDEADLDDDVIDCRVPHALWGFLPEGIRSEDGEGDLTSEGGEEAEFEVRYPEAVTIEQTQDLTDWRIVDVGGVEPTLDAGYIEGDTLAERIFDLEIIEPPTDSQPPDESPTPMVLGGPRYLAVTWPAVVNNDPVTYEVHLSTSEAFSPDETTLVGEVQGTMFFIRIDAAGEPLAYETPYFVQVIARDEDGAAAPGGEVSALLDPNGVDDILAGSVTAEKFAAVLVLSSTIKTADAGQRVEMDTDGIRLLTPDDNVVVDLPTDPDRAARFFGSVDAADLTVREGSVHGNLDIGVDGGVVTVKSSLAAPISPPSITPMLVTENFDVEAWDDQQEVGQGRHALWYDGSTYFYYLEGYPTGSWNVIQVDDNGDRISSTPLDLPSGSWVITSICKLGSFWYGLGFSFTTQNVRQLTWNDNSGVPGTLTGNNVFSQWSGGLSLPFLTVDGTGLWLCQSKKTPIGGTHHVEFRRYSPLGSTWTLNSTTTSDVTVTNNGSQVITAYFRGEADFGATRHVVKHGNGTNWFVFNDDGEVQSDERWQVGQQGAAGLVWHGDHFDTMSPSSPLWAGYSPFITGDGTATTQFYGAYTWYDSSGDEHESLLSARAIGNLKQRYYIRFSHPAVPGTGGADEPDGVRVFLKQATDDPGDDFAEYFLQTAVHEFDDTYQILEDYTTAVAGEQGTPFEDAVPAQIQSEQGGFVVDGLGEGAWPYLQPPGAVTMFAGAVVPDGWLLCNGQSVLRDDYPDLFAAIGTTYGTADSDHFNVPNLQGRVPTGVSASDSDFDLGDTGGSKTHTLTVGQMPSHTHTVDRINAAAGNADGVVRAGTNPTGNTSTTSSTGSGNPHSIMQPYIALNFIIKI